jgi:hypothetical protein
MVLTMLPPTALVVIENVALAAPPGTATVAGTVAPSVLDNETTAPPAGAAPVKATVPVTGFPPTTLDALSAIEEIATELVTVSIGDCRLPPFRLAVIIAVPGVMAVTMNVALDEPAATVTEVCTVATEGLLLDSEIVAPADGAAAVRLTVPSPRAPAEMLVAFSATPDTPVDAVGPLGEPEPPQAHNATTLIIVATSLIVATSRTDSEWTCFGSLMEPFEQQQRCQDPHFEDLAGKARLDGTPTQQWCVAKYRSWSRR